MISIIEQLLDWLYCRNCYICNKNQASLGSICKNCFDEIVFDDKFKPVKFINNIDVYAAGTYEKNLKTIIRAFKFHKKKDLAKILAKTLFSYWEKIEINDKNNFEIVPMPVHDLRKKERGYDHILLLAKEFSKLTGYDVNEKIVKKIKNTKPQYSLSREQRQDNVKDSFKVCNEHYNGKKLLLIDDICTTGATLRALTGEFKKNNIHDLCVIVIANV